MKGAGPIEIGAVVVAAIVSLLIISVGYSTGESIEGLIRVETIDIVGQRFDSAIYMASALDQGQIELELEDTYGLEKRAGSVYVNYSITELELPVLSTDSGSEIDPPVDFTAEEGESDVFCVSKNGGVSVETGECTG